MGQSRKGVLTVEAALVMPVILGVIFLLYSLAMVEYQNVVARAEAMRVANRAAMNWNTIGAGHDILIEDLKPVVFSAELAKGVENGKTGAFAVTSESFKEHNPYRFFVELFTVGSSKQKSLQDYLAARMSGIKDLETGISATNSSDIKGDSGFHIFNRYVSVTIDNSYNSPMLGLLSRMGFPVKQTYTVTAKAKLTEPADFVRNVSYIQEVIRKWKKKNGSDE